MTPGHVVGGDVWEVHLVRGLCVSHGVSVAVGNLKPPPSIPTMLHSPGPIGSRIGGRKGWWWR